MLIGIEVYDLSFIRSRRNIYKITIMAFDAGESIFGNRDIPTRSLAKNA